MDANDAELVDRVRDGDAAAFEQLMRRHFRMAFVLALARVNNHADAEDICQDAFVSAWRHIDDCREPSRFSAWLARIVRNTAHNRREYLRVRSVESIESAAHVAATSDTHHDTVRGDLRVRLLGALATLGHTQREIVLLHDLEGWRHAEIAERVEISEMMSRRHLSDARKQLRALLGSYETLEPDHD
jgi:RNA polymerase sigma-70 factor, ECF subfamily